MNRVATIHLLLLLAIATLCYAPFRGMEHIPARALWGNAEQYVGSGEDYAKVDILWKLRIPRVLLAFAAGAALAVSGMVFQAVFRSPLTTPFTLGVSSGASLAAAVFVGQQWMFPVLGISSVSLAGAVGAALSILLIYLLTAGGRRGSSIATMLLVGATVSLCLSALIVLLQFRGGPACVGESAHAFRVLRWVIGGLDSVVSLHDVLDVLPFLLSGCLLVWYLTLGLNLLSTGEDFAFSRGVNVKQMKLLLFLAVSLMAGAAVATCGPIGFVGLVAPRICRKMVGPDHRYLFPATWLVGGVLLVICDTAARTIMAPTELPVGILTALLGGPVFIGLLLARRHELGTL
jgi:iron complex transport system permease protein